MVSPKSPFHLSQLSFSMEVLGVDIFTVASDKEKLVECLVDFIETNSSLSNKGGNTIV